MRHIVWFPGFFNQGSHLRTVYYFPDYEFVVLNALLKASKEIVPKIILKMHPGGERVNRKLLKQRTQDYPNFQIIEEADSIELIKNSCLVIISQDSTLGLDAVIQKKPLFLVNLYNKNPTVFREKKVAVEITTPGELTKAVVDFSKFLYK